MSEIPECVRRAIDSFEVEETVRLEKTHGIDADTGEVRVRIEPCRVTVKKVKHASRLGALQILTKQQGLLYERVRLTVEDGAMDGMDETALAARVAGIIEAACKRREALENGEDLV